MEMQTTATDKLPERDTDKGGGRRGPTIPTILWTSLMEARPLTSSAMTAQLRGELFQHNSFFARPTRSGPSIVA